MCIKCKRAHLRAQLHRLLMGMLVLIFFSIMVTDALTGCTGKPLTQLFVNPSTVRM